MVVFGWLDFDYDCGLVDIVCCDWGLLVVVFAALVYFGLRL